jgi:hypothetical protein
MTVEAGQVLNNISCKILSDKEIGRGIVLLLGELVSVSQDCCDTLVTGLSDIKDKIIDSNGKIDDMNDKLDDIIEQLSA